MPGPAVPGSNVPLAGTVIPVPLQVPPLGFAIISVAASASQKSPVFEKLIVGGLCTVTRTVSVDSHKGAK